MDWIKTRVAVITPEMGAVLMALLSQAGVMAGSLLDNRGLLMWCFIGSVFGAYVKVAFKPPHLATQQRNLQQLAAEFAAAMFCGFCLTPLVVHYCNLPLNSAVAIGVSFLVSVFGVGVVHAVAPLVEKFAVKRAQQKLDSSIIKADASSILDSDFKK